MGEMAGPEHGGVVAGRYVIERLLGAGDRKRTYLARDMKVDRHVAVSVVRPEAVLSDPGGTEREAKVRGRIGSHPNIVSLHDFEIDPDGSIQYMVFDYLSGGTLAEYLQEAGRQSLDDILRFGRQLSRGLAHLHGRGLIHRDVSPDNVWLDQRRVAHLGDFDSAITTSGSDDELRPITTGSFAAPEEHDGRPLDARSDLFSLGGLLYVLATGECRPGDPALVRSLRPDLPSTFADLVTGLLADQPEDRPVDADDVLRWLDDVRRSSSIDALIAAGESDTTEFKSSLRHPYGPLPPALQAQIEQGKVSAAQIQKDIEKELQTAITKTIAAFLNTDGGMLLIGGDDSGAILGIEADYPHLKTEHQNHDGWLSSLKQTIVNALGPEVWGAIRVSLVRRDPVTVAVVICPARATETWHQGDVFHMRTSNGTTSLTGAGLLRYIREHWPA